MARILLIEDDISVLDVVRTALQAENHLVDVASTGTDAEAFLSTYDYDLMILDLSLPDTDGLDILSRYRQSQGNAQVLIVTGRTSQTQKITGLDLGADDYLTKPVDIRELRARVRARLRRPAQYTPNLLKVGSLTIDPDNFTAVRNGKSVKLPPKEYALLEYLAKNRGRIIGIDELLDNLWSSESTPSSENLRALVKRLRKHLETTEDDPIIENAYGQGYRLIDEAL